MPRLLEGIRRILSADRGDLASPELVADQVRYVGLAFDRRLVYGADNRYMNTESTGVRHVPMQLARCLVELLRRPLTRVLEVGAGNGWRTAIVTAYLSRFNDHLEVLCIDDSAAFDSYEEVAHLLPIQYRPGTKATDVRSESFDLVWLRSDQGYDQWLADYRNVGRAGRLCLLDGINDQFAAKSPARGGGVPRAWQELKKLVREGSWLEFTDHSNNERILGIGLLVHDAPVSQETWRDADVHLATSGPQPA